MEKQSIAIYPGTFDPITNGHVSLVKRGCAIFSKVVVAVAVDNNKKPLFTTKERVALAQECFADNPQVVVEPFSGLLVDYADRRGCTVILRGLRAVSDFEYEFQLALMNKKLKPHVQTIFLMTDYRWLYISSTIVKAAASLGGDVRDMVPPNVIQAFRKRYGNPYSLTNHLPEYATEDPGEPVLPNPERSDLTAGKGQPDD